MTIVFVTMRYLMDQFNAVELAISLGRPLQDVLSIKWYVQQLMTSQILKYLKTCSSVLEIGCGGSLTAHFLSLQGHKVYGIDVNEECIRYSRTLGMALGSSALFAKANAFFLPFKDQQFDYVYSVGLLEHFTEHRQHLAVREMHRVCRRYIHLEIPNASPLSSFYVIGARSDEVHLQCNPGSLLAQLGYKLVEVDGRCVFDVLGNVQENPSLLSFLRRRAPELLANTFSGRDIDRLCRGEQALSIEERLIYGFQLFWVAERPQQEAVQ